MPIYEYQCLACEKITEVMQKFSDAPLDVCPECGGHLKKLISNSSFVLKGTGWYKTDYASGGASAPKKSTETKKEKADKKSKAAKSGESGTEGAKEAKTETKKETVPASK